MENAGKIILGTVQFGLEYGIASEGRPSLDQVFEILDYAFEQGIKTLDTASAYGNAYEIIGKYHAARSHQFQVITKFKLGKDASFDFDAIIPQTLDQLNIDSLEALLYHSVEDFRHHSRFRKSLLTLKEKGWVKQIGFSVYTNDQFKLAIDTEGIDIIQLPYNLLDNQRKRGELIKEARDKGKIIHTRSAFLQGLFFKPTQTLPTVLKPLFPFLEKITTFSVQENISIANLALNYPFQNPDISGVLLGVDNLAQLNTNLNQLDKPLGQELIQKIDTLDVSAVSLLNPSNWK